MARRAPAPRASFVLVERVLEHLVRDVAKPPLESLTSKGAVMPMAISQAIDVAVAPRSDGRLRAASTRFPRVLDISVDEPEPPAGWHRYVWAVARQVPGFGGADIAAMIWDVVERKVKAERRKRKA